MPVMQGVHALEERAQRSDERAQLSEENAQRSAEKTKKSERRSTLLTVLHSFSWISLSCIDLLHHPLPNQT